MKEQTFASIVWHEPLGLVSCLMLGLGLVVGCKPKSSSPTPVSSQDSIPKHSASSTAYVQTPFKSECQFIVQAIVSDLAEQMYFAANHRLPAEKSFSVAATEKPGTSPDAPVFELQITLDSKQMRCDVAINGPIWSPQVYETVATQLAQAVALSPSRSELEEGAALLAQLKDGTPETIERENQRVSAALQNDFANSELHEQAALLFGALLLRDHSGKFFEIRSPLSRLTAHLAVARFLRGSKTAGINGQMAEAMMLTLAGNQALALERLNSMGTNNAAVLPFVRALRTRNTGDYRALDKLGDRSRVESVEWFHAWASYVATSMAWPKLSGQQQQTIDFVRTAHAASYSVEVGHQLLEASIPLELQESASVYALSQSRQLNPKNLIAVLNELPEGCFTRSGGTTHVRVIGWGQWANFLQRHLCYAIQQNFHFMNDSWGVPDDAKEFAAKCESFSGLRLYPFVRRFNCSDVESYHKAVDEGVKVIVATPQLVPVECWNYLAYKPKFAPLYIPNPNPHVNEWHNDNAPPGTVYDFHPRLNRSGLVNRADALGRLERLHEMAPYDSRITHFLLQKRNYQLPTYQQVGGLFQAVLPYSVDAMLTVAKTVSSQPERYRELMLEAAALDPACYYTLGDYEIARHDEELAAKYIDQACAADPDSVRVSHRAYWRVQYYVKKGQIEKARRIADEGAEVYSSGGLEAKATFLEMTTNYDGAFKWFAKIEERYDNPSALIAFCERYKQLTGDTRFDSEMKKRANKLFANGLEKVSLADFHGPPTDGVAIKQQNDLLTAAGLRGGDVIVALNGTRTRTFIQYMYVRDLLIKPEMDLIVFQGRGYREIKASPPNHKFGVNFGDFRAE